MKPMQLGGTGGREDAAAVEPRNARNPASTPWWRKLKRIFRRGVEVTNEEEMERSHNPLQEFARSTSSSQKWRRLNETLGKPIEIVEGSRVASWMSREHCFCPGVIGTRPLRKVGDGFAVKIRRLRTSYAVFSAGVVAANGDLGKRTGRTAVGRDPMSCGVFIPKLVLDEQHRTKPSRCLATSTARRPIRYLPSIPLEPQLSKAKLAVGERDILAFKLVRCMPRGDVGLDVCINGEHIAVVPIPAWFQLPLIPCATIPKHASLEISPLTPLATL